MYSWITIFCPKCGCGQDIKAKPGTPSLAKAPLYALAELDGTWYTCISCEYLMQIVVQRMVSVE